MRRTGPRPRVQGRTAPALAAALALATMLVAPLAGAATAAAAPADDCAAPTRTVTGAGWTPVAVAAGEVVLVTGRVSGGVDGLPAGATLCVAPGAELAPSYLNDPRGVLHVAPGATARLPWLSVTGGFVLDNAGTVTVQGLNVNGAATLHNAAGASLTVTSAFAPSAGTVRNEGDLALPAGATLNPAASLVSSGRVVVGGDLVLDGALENTGTVTVAGSVLVNGRATFRNGCVLQAAALTHSGGTASNTGLVALGGTFTTTGTWQQSGTGALSARDLRDDGAVRGFGRYVFTGSTSVQGSFAGDSAAAPITVDVPGAGFGVATGTVANVVFGDVDLGAVTGYPAPDCAGATPPASADVRVQMTGPAVVQPGAAVTYTVVVANDGPSPAAAVRVVQALPAAPQGELAGVTAGQGGVLGAGTVTWDLGTLAPGATRTLTVTGTAPGTGYLLSTVRGESGTADPDPTNNDGSAATERVGTEIDAAPVPDPAPTASDGTYVGVGGVPVLGALAGTLGADGLQLRFAVTSPADAGAVALTPGGLFAYLPDPDFAGTDTFTFRVCDNQVPERCSADATATVVLHPAAADDEATTDRDQPVALPVSANDSGGAVLTDLVAAPAHGQVALDPTTGTATYTPDPGFVGDDTFTYRACAAADAADCATAVATVHVRAVNRAPQALLVDLATTVGQAVGGPIDATDPDGDAVGLLAVSPAVHGSAAVDGPQVRYTPAAGLAGRDLFAYVACDDGDPALCSTGLVTALVGPVAGDDRAATTAGVPVALAVSGNDQGTVLPPEVLTGPANGTVALVAGDLVYTPAPGFSGTDRLTYRICADDGSEACAAATVTVDVAAAPVAEPDPGTGPGSGAGPGAAPGDGAAGDPVTAGAGGSGRGLAVTGAGLAGAAGVVAALVTGGVLLRLAARRRRAG